MIEPIMLPTPNINSSQYGFRPGRGTTTACNLLNDINCYFNKGNTPVYTCSLDAEKCFDRLWHSALLFKLINVIDIPFWLFLYRWYNTLKAVVRWNNNLSQMFDVTRGSRQGSILSPIIFNVFIDDLLYELSGTEHGVRIGKFKCNSFAYADDITLICATATGLQCLIDKCTLYSQKWRFNFNLSKTKCMVTGKTILKGDTVWFLNGQPIENVSKLDILGCSFSSNGKASLHVDKRTQSCRQAFYNLGEIGMSYPGLDSMTKAHLWRTVCNPSLVYGCDSFSLSNRDVQKLESTQANLLKQALGLRKRSHHSNLLQALHVQKVSDVITKNTLSLYYRIFTVDTPTRDLCTELLNMYITKGKIIDGTILSRVRNSGHSPVLAAFNKCNLPHNYHSVEDGVVSSLRYLLCHENYIKPYSSEHLLAVLLTRAF